MQQLVTLAYVVGIAGLFWLNRDGKSRTSLALLLPFVWLLIAGSRNASQWLDMGNVTTAGEEYLEGNPLDRNLLAALIFIGIIVLIQRRQKVLAILQANLPIVLFFSYCAFSLFWSDFPFVGFKRWIRGLGDVVMVLVVLTDRDWLAARKKVYAWVGFFVIPLSILLIRDYPELGRAYGVDGSSFWTGVTTNKNELGMVCMIFGLAAVARLFDIWCGREGKKKTRLLLAHGVIVAMAAWLIHVANSATSLACFGLGTCILVATHLRPVLRRPSLLHLIVWSLLFVSFSALFLGVGSGLVQDLGRNSTLTGRTDVWKKVVTYVDNPVLGAGYESFWLGPRLEKMRDFAGGLNQAHNGYIEIYLNLGWVGIILLGVVIFTGYRHVIRLFRYDPDAARLMLVYFVVALPYNFTESAFKMRSPVWISFLIATMAIPQLSAKKRKKEILETSVAEEDVPVKMPMIAARSQEKYI